MHPNVKVFRHPDHHPSGYDVKSELESSFKNLSLRTFDLAKVSGDALKTLYGTSDDIVLFWAHHEKLCIVDGRIAFMGGLDMCRLSAGLYLGSRGANRLANTKLPRLWALGYKQ